MICFVEGRWWLLCALATAQELNPMSSRFLRNYHLNGSRILRLVNRVYLRVIKDKSTLELSVDQWQELGVFTKILNQFAAFAKTHEMSDGKPAVWHAEKKRGVGRNKYLPVLGIAFRCLRKSLC
jgi:hypothetical protein